MKIFGKTEAAMALILTAFIVFVFAIILAVMS